MNAPNRNPSGASPSPSRPSDSGAAGEDLAVRRRRLAFRSWHRGTREADLLIGSFANRHLGQFDAAALDAYEALLERSDPDIYNWITGREPVPEELDGPVLRALMAHKIRPEG